SADEPAGSPRSAPSAPLVLVDGPRATGSLVAADKSWLLAFTGQSGRRNLPAAELAWWGTPVEPPRWSFDKPERDMLVLLAEGGLVVADVMSGDRDQLRVESSLAGPLELPLDRVTALAAALPESAQSRDRVLDELRSRRAETDEVWLEGGDRLK